MNFKENDSCKSKYSDSKSFGLKVLMIYLLVSGLWFATSNIFDIEANSYLFVFISALIIYIVFLNKLKYFESVKDSASTKHFEYDNIHKKYLELSDKVKSLYQYDQLTGLLNRYSFANEADTYISENKDSLEFLSFLYIDIDKFNLINDSLGHECGDQLLKILSVKLKHLVSCPGLVGRLGGDEFMIMLDSSSISETMDFADSVLKTIREPLCFNEKEVFLTASIGISVYPNDGCDFLTLLKNSDTANTYAKSTGRDKYLLYSTDLKNRTMKNAHMINQLRYALENDEFALYYQPKVDLQTGSLMGVEALIRWIHPKLGSIPPLDFIPFAEETGFIYEIEKWVMQKAFLKRKFWSEKYGVDIVMCINLSGKSIMEYKTVDVLRDIIGDDFDSLEYFEVEVTETAIMANLDIALRTLNGIKDLGIEIALDDFGTGYSSLTYLEKLPIDVLKIDQTFTNSISLDRLADSDTEIIVKSVISLAHDLNLTTVAEGIETYEQAEFFKSHKCDIGQGYLFSKPLPESEVEKLISQRHIFKI